MTKKPYEQYLGDVLGGSGASMVAEDPTPQEKGFDLGSMPVFKLPPGGDYLNPHAGWRRDNDPGQQAPGWSYPMPAGGGGESAPGWSAALNAPQQATPGMAANARGGKYTNADIIKAFKEITGRDPAPGEVNWGNDIDQAYYDKIIAAIKSNYPKAPAAPSGGGGGTNSPAPSTDWAKMDYRDTNNIRAFFQSKGLSGDVLERVVNTWANYRAQPWANDTDYFFRRMAAEEELGGGGDYEFNDPWGRDYERRIRQYDEESRKRAAELADKYRKRAGELQGPAYTSGDEAIIRAKAFDQLERRRQETLKNDREGIYARGFAPTSGLVREATNSTNDRFEGARGTIESNLAQAEMDETERRKDAAVQLEALATQALNGGDLSAIQQIASMNGLLNQRQSAAMQLLDSGNSSSMISQILQMLSMAQSNQNNQNQQNAGNAAGWGQLIAMLAPYLTGARSRGY